MNSVFKKSLIILVSSLGLLSLLIVLGSSFIIFSKPQVAITFIERFIPDKSTKPTAIKGIAVIGDSQADEYRADDSRGLTYASTTFNWVELLQKYRKLNFGPWETNPEPRRKGYAYNWSRTGATVESMLMSGQHEGVAEQVKAGKVNIVIIAIGANDYAPLLTPDGYDAMYAGTLTESQILKKKNRVVADISTAVDTIRIAGNARILLITIPDWGHHLGVRIAFPLPEPRARVSDIVAKTNLDLLKMAHEREIEVVDSNAFFNQIFNESVTEVTVGQQSFSGVLPGDDPRSLFLEDATHSSTVLNGLFANTVITHLNQLTGATIRPFSNDEILSHAGL